MIQVRFSPQTPLLVVTLALEQQRRVAVRMALDTGATYTTITPTTAARLGFDIPADTTRRPLHGVAGSVLAPSVTIHRVLFGREHLTDLVAYVTPLPAQFGVHGLLGLNFIRHFRVTLDFGKGLATFERLPKR